MMKQKEKQIHSVQPNKKSNIKKLRMMVDDCTVTLNFPSKAQDSVMTEIKRMILSSHTHAKM